MLRFLNIIKQKGHRDNRGILRETYRKNVINWDNLVFDYATSSKKNVLRGFHFQSKFKQAKFLSVLKGKIFDCVVDKVENCYPMIPSGKPHNQMLLGIQDEKEEEISEEGKVLV